MRKVAGHISPVPRAENGEGKGDEEGTECHLRRSLIPSVIYRDPPDE